jgi:hypothetical protein
VACQQARDAVRIIMTGAREALQSMGHLPSPVIPLREGYILPGMGRALADSGHLVVGL